MILPDKGMPGLTDQHARRLKETRVDAMRGSYWGDGKDGEAEPALAKLHKRGYTSYVVTEAKRAGQAVDRPRVHLGLLKPLSPRVCQAMGRLSRFANLN